MSWLREYRTASFRLGLARMGYVASTGGLEAVQDCALTDAELCPAGLALKVLDVFLTAMATAADKGVDLVIGDAVIQAIAVWAGVPGRHDPFLAERAAGVFKL